MILALMSSIDRLKANKIDYMIKMFTYFSLAGTPTSEKKAVVFPLAMTSLLKPLATIKETDT